MLTQFDHRRPAPTPSTEAEASATFTPVDPTSDLRAFSLIGGAGVAALSIGPNLGPLCPLRRLTGVPCPLCGGTTAALAVARGDVAAALAASPLAVLVFVVIAAAWLWWLLFRTGLLDRPESTGGLRRRVAPLAAPLLAGSWLFQLHRYDVI